MLVTIHNNTMVKLAFKTMFYTFNFHLLLFSTHGKDFSLELRNLSQVSLNRILKFLLHHQCQRTYANSRILANFGAILLPISIYVSVCVSIYEASIYLSIYLCIILSINYESSVYLSIYLFSLKIVK
jgi:hypothetical protein